MYVINWWFEWLKIVIRVEICDIGSIFLIFVIVLYYIDLLGVEWRGDLGMIFCFIWKIVLFDN